MVPLAYVAGGLRHLMGAQKEHCSEILTGSGGPPSGLWGSLATLHVLRGASFFEDDAIEPLVLPILREVVWDGAHATGSGDMADACRFLRRHKETIESVTLRGGVVNVDQFEVLVGAVVELELLEDLDLVGNDLTDCHALALIRAIEACPRLRRLNLSRNRLGASGASAVLNACASRVTWLSLEQNGIGIGMTSLFQHYDASSLNALFAGGNGNSEAEKQIRALRGARQERRHRCRQAVTVLLAFARFTHFGARELPADMIKMLARNIWNTRHDPAWDPAL